MGVYVRQPLYTKRKGYHAATMVGRRSLGISLGSMHLADRELGG